MRDHLPEAGPPLRATRRAFTVVLCLDCSSEAPPLLAALRATVRRCDHGVLVTAARPPASDPIGAFVAVQPCSIDRRPSGPATWIGPIGGIEHVRAVCDWLQRGDWDTSIPADAGTAGDASRN